MCIPIFQQPCSSGLHFEPPLASKAAQSPLTTFQSPQLPSATQSQLTLALSEQPCSSGHQFEATPSPKRPCIDRTAPSEVQVMIFSPLSTNDVYIHHCSLSHQLVPFQEGLLTTALDYLLGGRRTPQPLTEPGLGGNYLLPRERW